MKIIRTTILVAALMASPMALAGGDNWFSDLKKQWNSESNRHWGSGEQSSSEAKKHWSSGSEKKWSYDKKKQWGHTKHQRGCGHSQAPEMDVAGAGIAFGLVLAVTALIRERRVRK